MTHTPRQQLQLLAQSLHLHGDVQYVSAYAHSAWSMETPGWYLTTDFNRRNIVVNRGQYLGRRWVDALRELQRMGKISMS